MPRYIDADALKDVIQQHDYPLADRLNSVDNGMFTLGIFQAIDEQPTISPDEVRGVGKWERYEKENPNARKCSRCKNCYVNAEHPKHLWRFCPECGVRMRR